MSPLIQAGITIFLIVVVAGAALVVIRARERRFRRAHAELSEMKRRMHNGLALSSMSMFTVGRDGVISSFAGRWVPDTRLSMTTCVGLPAEEGRTGHERRRRGAGEHRGAARRRGRIRDGGVGGGPRAWAECGGADADLRWTGLAVSHVDDAVRRHGP